MSIRRLSPPLLVWSTLIVNAGVLVACGDKFVGCPEGTCGTAGTANNPSGGSGSGGSGGSDPGGAGGQGSAAGTAGAAGDTGVGGQTPGACKSSSDCNDQLRCTVDTCDAGQCRHEAYPCAPKDAANCESLGCTEDETKPICTIIPRDADNDGHRSAACKELTESGGDDCNDDDVEVYPNHKEVCDGKDNDCNGKVDVDDGLLLGGENKTLFSTTATVKKFGSPALAWSSKLLQFGVAFRAENSQSDINRYNMGRVLSFKPDGELGPIHIDLYAQIESHDQRWLAEGEQLALMTMPTGFALGRTLAPSRSSINRPVYLDEIQGDGAYRMGLSYQSDYAGHQTAIGAVKDSKYLMFWSTSTELSWRFGVIGSGNPSAGVEATDKIEISGLAATPATEDSAAAVWVRRDTTTNKARIDWGTFTLGMERPKLTILDEAEAGGSFSPPVIANADANFAVAFKYTDPQGRSRVRYTEVSPEGVKLCSLWSSEVISTWEVYDVAMTRAGAVIIGQGPSGIDFLKVQECKGIERIPFVSEVSEVDPKFRGREARLEVTELGVATVWTSALGLRYRLLDPLLCSPNPTPGK